MWTRFMDMHSGGGTKEKPYENILIEAPMNEAKVIFYNRFGHSPERVTCTCCGEDYSINETETLEQATAYDRGCRYDEVKRNYVEEPSGDSFSEYLTLEKYLKNPDVLVIPKSEIKESECKGEVPTQGYMWVD